MASAADHLSDDELDEVNANAEGDRSRIESHLRACSDCRRRRAELIELRHLLAQTGVGERQPMRDVVPSVMKRLRLRRHSVSNANEFLEGVAAFVRGLASLFSEDKRRG